MDIIKQKRFYSLTITVLVIINLLLVSLLWLGRPQPGKMPPPEEKNNAQVKEMLIKELNFNDDQIDKYLSLRKNHRDKLLKIQDEINQLKKEMFDKVLEDNSNSEISDSLLSLVLDKQAELEKLTFKHFIDLKNLCGPNQKEKLKFLMQEVFRPKFPPNLRNQRPPHRKR